MIQVHMGPAGRKVKEAFSWKTILTSQGGQIYFLNLDSVLFKEVYEKWVKRHQNALTMQENTSKRSEKK